MPGGELEIEIMPDGMVFMTGSVNRIGRRRLAKEFKKNVSANPILLGDERT